MSRKRIPDSATPKRRYHECGQAQVLFHSTQLQGAHFLNKWTTLEGEDIQNCPACGERLHYGQTLLPELLDGLYAQITVLQGQLGADLAVQLEIPLDAQPVVLTLLKLLAPHLAAEVDALDPRDLGHFARMIRMDRTPHELRDTLVKQTAVELSKAAACHLAAETRQEEPA